MSKTNQKLRPQKTQVSTFTKQQSTALVQNTCLSFVSMVTYLREIFSDDAYEEITYSSATFKTIKKDGGDGSDSKKAKKMLEFLQGDIYDLIEDGHLEHLMLAIYTKAPARILLEQYLLRISTPEAGQTFKVTLEATNGKKKSQFQLMQDNVKANFRSIVRNIQVISSTQNLLPDNGVDIKLVAVLKENAPRDNDNLLDFKAFDGDKSSLKFAKDVDSVSMDLGNLATAHHKLTVKMRVKQEDFDILEDAEEIEIASPAVPMEYSSSDSEDASLTDEETSPVSKKKKITKKRKRDNNDSIVKSSPSVRRKTTILPKKKKKQKIKKQREMKNDTLHYGRN